MSIDISPEIGARLATEAERQGISIDALLERLMSERSPANAGGASPACELPILRLGAMGELHRRDLYERGFSITA